MSALERSLDEIIGDRPKRNSGPRQPRGRNPPRNRISKPRKERAAFEQPRVSVYDKLANGKQYLKVKNLHYELTEQDIFDLFSKVGQVEFARIDFDKSGRSNGVAFVCFEDPEAHNAEAIAKFDGKKAAGRDIHVSVANLLASRIAPLSNPSRGPREPRGPRNKSLREKKVRKSADDLDNELDSYMNGPTEVGSEPAREGDVAAYPPYEETRPASEPFAAVSTGDGMALD